MFVPGVQIHRHLAAWHQLRTAQFALQCLQTLSQCLRRGTGGDIDRFAVAERADPALPRNSEDGCLDSGHGQRFVFDSAQQVQIADVFGVNDGSLLHAFASNGQTGSPLISGWAIECEPGGKLAIAAQPHGGQAAGGTGLSQAARKAEAGGEQHEASPRHRGAMSGERLITHE
jgi:hypothetical protein